MRADTVHCVWYDRMGIEIGVFLLDMLLEGGLPTKEFSRVIHGGANVQADLGVLAGY